MTTERIMEVTKVDVHIHKTNPPRFHLTATGKASSGSHTNPRLERRIYVVFPEDGIQEYDFVIDVPDGPKTDDINEHIAEDKWDGFPGQLKGVRVYAKKNQMEAGL